MENTYVVWDEDKQSFISSIGHNGIFHSKDLGGAFQYTDEDDAVKAAELLERGVVLQWL